MSDYPIKTFASEVVWESRWYRVRQDAIGLPDGSTGEYNVLEMRDSIFVVPVTDDGQIVLIRNYRHTLKEWCWELPAGGIQATQTPEEAVHNELREEIGGTAREIRFLLKACTMNGIGNHHAHFYIATGVTLANPEPEATEVITVHPVPIAEALTLARSGAMNDALSVTALLLATPYLDAALE